MKLDTTTTYESTTSVILANGGHYKHRIKRLVRNSQLQFFGVEEERLDLTRLKNDLDFWLRSLEDLLDGNYFTWHFPSRVQKLRNSQQKLDELKIKYHLGEKSAVASKESLPSDTKVLLPVEEITRRIAGLVTDLRNTWISASINPATTEAESCSSPDHVIVWCGFEESQAWCTVSTACATSPSHIIQYSVVVARSSASMRERRLRLYGIFDVS